MHVAEVGILIYYECSEYAITISGKTYPYREAIKALGGRFVGHDKTWQVTRSEANLAQVEALCASLGGGPLPGAAPSTISDFAPENQSPEGIEANAPPPVAPPSPVGLTLSQLLQQISGAVNATFPHPVWVTGEVQNLNFRGDTLYLSLAEQDAIRHVSQSITVNAVIWPSVYQKLCQQHGKEALQGVLQDGMQILCRCEVSLYKGRGSISLSLLDVDLSFTKGKLALEREKLLRELRSQGLDRTNKSRELARMPLRIGLLTAEGSRAESDFLHQLEEGGFPGTVLFLPTPMQGEKVPKAVSQAIDQLVAADCDLIVITRGGGSAADLRWFDGREIAYKIATCPIPVVAAIGHHDDVCVAEEICFLRMKTPTAAADFVISCFQPIWTRLDECREQLLVRTERCLQQNESQLTLLGRTLHHGWQHSLTRTQQNLEHLQGELLERFLREILRLDRIFLRLEATVALASLTTLHRREEFLRQKARQLWEGFQLGWHQQLAKVEHAEKGLVACDPSPWCAKGWTKLTFNGTTVRSIEGISIGAKVSTRLLDGNVHLRVEEIHPVEKNKN